MRRAAPGTISRIDRSALRASLPGAMSARNPEETTRAADAAIKAERRLEYVYYRGMAALLEVENRADRIARRELYRRCARIGETVVDVAERVVYAVVKDS